MSKDDGDQCGIMNTAGKQKQALLKQTDTTDGNVSINAAQNVEVRDSSADNIQDEDFQTEITHGSRRVKSRDNEQQQRKKRGMKSRSRRNRKKPRSRIHSTDDVVQKTSVCRLALDGKTINSSTGWIRTVEPYPYTFSSFAKARWVGRTVLDVYHTEFGSYPKVSSSTIRNDNG